MFPGSAALSAAVAVGTAITKPAAAGGGSWGLGGGGGYTITEAWLNRVTASSATFSTAVAFGA